MNFTEAPEVLVWLAATTAAGRLCLSLFPAGTPGRHAWGELSVTLAASYLLGSIAIEAEGRCFSAIGIDASPWILASPWIAIAIARWLTLPGALVPRLEMASERATFGVRALQCLSAIVVAFAAWKNRELLFRRVGDEGARDFLSGARAIADVLALVALCSYGLERARRSSLERALLMVLFASVIAFVAFADASQPTTHVALRFGAGAALAIPWLRRADRRAAAIAVTAFAGLTLDWGLDWGLESGLVSEIDPARQFGLPPAPGTALALAGLAWLCACTARPSRKFVGLSSAIAFVISLVLRSYGVTHPPRGPGAMYLSREYGAMHPSLSAGAMSPPGSNGAMHPSLSAGAQNPPASAIEAWSRAAFHTNGALLASLAILFALTWMLATWMRWRQRHRDRLPEGSDAEPTSTEVIVFERDTGFLSELGFSTLILLLVYAEWRQGLAGIDVIPLFAPLVLLSIGTVLVRRDRGTETA